MPRAVYSASEVSQKAKIVFNPEPSFTEKARKNSVKGTVLFTTVLCKSGNITNIQVVEGLPFGMTEEAIKAARQIKFEPAEKSGRKVSPLIRLEYNFIAASNGELPMVEAAKILSLKKMRSEESMEKIKDETGQTIHPRTDAARFLHCNGAWSF